MSKAIPADTLFKSALIIDGSGAPGFVGDVAIADDRIVAVGNTAGVEACTVIDVSGKAMAPGFIDTHTHDDCALLRTPAMAMKTSQGVTTVVAGNCGASLAPLVAERVPPPLDLVGGGIASPLSAGVNAPLMSFGPPIETSGPLTPKSATAKNKMVLPSDAARKAPDAAIMRPAPMMQRRRPNRSSNIPAGIAATMQSNCHAPNTAPIARQGETQIRHDGTDERSESAGRPSESEINKPEPRAPNVPRVMVFLARSWCVLARTVCARDETHKDLRQRCC